MHQSIPNRHRVPRGQRQGLILLLALGMLALFSLLAVTWVVSASSSRSGAQAMRIRANHSNASVKGMASEVMKLAVRGTRDQKSAFYAHSLLEDVYDPNAIRVQFGHRFYGAGFNTFQDKWCRKLTPPTGAGVELLKLSLDPRNQANLGGGYPTYQLSPIEGAYNGRVLTILEGPWLVIHFESSSTSDTSDRLTIRSPTRISTGTCRVRRKGIILKGPRPITTIRS